MRKSILQICGILLLAFGLAFNLQAKELAGVTVPDEITLTGNNRLILNGMGLREKLWIDVYVGSLYLGRKADNVAEVLSQPGAMRIQMNFVYNEVASNKLIKAWRDGFEKNQSPAKLEQLRGRIETFYSYFNESARKDDVFNIDYLPEVGSSVFKNGQLLGTIEGLDFRNALLEIWLGNSPADGGLKKGMLGLD